MKKNLVLCIENNFGETELFKIKCNKIQKYHETYHFDTNSLMLETNGIELHYFLQELHKWNVFRQHLCKLLSHNQLMIIKVIPPEKEIIDYKWNRITSFAIWQKIEIENLMSWLSTLGGGFSALGESFLHCAETAGKISLRQLNVGLKLGDPFLQSRCKLFYSISLIQTGKLRSAKYIIREQYKFAVANKELDGRLIKMCQGIWLRLQYEYSQRRNAKKSVVGL